MEPSHECIRAGKYIKLLHITVESAIDKINVIKKKTNQSNCQKICKNWIIQKEVINPGLFQSNRFVILSYNQQVCIKLSYIPVF